MRVVLLLNKSFHSQYVKRFRIEDEIQFSSGKLLQASTPEGKRVFLQSIPIEGKVLPENFRNIVLRLQHPHLAPIIDVMVDENEVILVHPPFTGEPLPLLVTKERPMKPLKALKVAKSLLSTVRELSRRKFPLRATLDPKNILFSGSEPLLLFYYLGDEVQVQRDTKWRDLLFFLLTGHNPSKNPKNNKALLNNNMTPRKLQKLALNAIKSKSSLEEIILEVDKLIKDRNLESGKENKWQTAILSTAVAVLLIVLGGFGWKMFSNEGNASNKTTENQEVFQIHENGIEHDFADSSTYTLKKTMENASVLQGELTFSESFEGLTASLNKKDGSGKLSLYIDKNGSITTKVSQDNREMVYTRATPKGVVQPGRTYDFFVYYTPENPLKIQLKDKETKKGYVLAGSTNIMGGLVVEFQGSEGVVLKNPDVLDNQRPSDVESEFLKNHDWKLDAGAGIYSPESLVVFPNSKVKLPLKASFNNLQFTVDKKSKGPFNMILDSVDGTNYLISWGDGKAKLILQSGIEQKVLKQVSTFELDNQKPVTLYITIQGNDLAINVNQGSNNSFLLGATAEQPLSLRDLTILNSEEIKLIKY